MKIQKMLVYILKPILNEEQIIGVCIMLQNSEESMMELGYLIATENMTNTQIMEKAMELHDNLPKELQVAENYSED